MFSKAWNTFFPLPLFLIWWPLICSGSSLAVDITFDTVQEMDFWCVHCYTFCRVKGFKNISELKYVSTLYVRNIF